jgi:hypothetical protein
VESVALGVGTAEESTETTGTAVAGTDTTTAASHNLLSGLQDGTGLPVVR